MEGDTGHPVFQVSIVDLHLNKLGGWSKHER
jgi:hypothetical protein